MAIYSFSMTLALLLSAPWWLWRMARTGRYREGLRERLGQFPASIRDAAAGQQVVWLHAVSVGEVLAAERLIHELQSALGEDWVIAISTTTATGQQLARERFPGSPVFFFPLDLAFAVRSWLRVLRPRLMILVESEFWPRHLAECERARIPVAVVNARVSDRSFPRYLRLRAVWRPLFAKVALFLAQGEETADRLRLIGAPADRIRTPGNLKCDIRAPKASRMAEWLKAASGQRQIVVAGSTVDSRHASEEQIFLQGAMGPVWQSYPDTLLVIAPRHPQRFDETAELASHFGTTIRATAAVERMPNVLTEQIVVLDTIGDLASVYSIADVAFVGGSLVRAGGHNPLEPAQFGVPVIMGPSFENFRDTVTQMQAARAIATVADEFECYEALINLLGRRNEDRAIGAHGKQFVEQQRGATDRTVQALLELLHA